MNCISRTRDQAGSALIAALVLAAAAAALIGILGTTIRRAIAHLSDTMHASRAESEATLELIRRLGAAGAAPRRCDSVRTIRGKTSITVAGCAFASRNGLPLLDAAAIFSPLRGCPVDPIPEPNASPGSLAETCVPNSFDADGRSAFLSNFSATLVRMTPSAAVSAAGAVDIGRLEATGPGLVIAGGNLTIGSLSAPARSIDLVSIRGSVSLPPGALASVRALVEYDSGVRVNANLLPPEIVLHRPVIASLRVGE